MAQVGKDNSGKLKKNPKKTEAKHPDFKGGATVGGTEYWLSAWENEDGSLGIAFTPKEDAGFSG